MNAPTAAKLLIVDDEDALMTALCKTLELEGYSTTGFTSARKALEYLPGHEFDLLLTDLMMPEMDGIALLRSARQIDRDLAGIVMTGHGTIDTAVASLQSVQTSLTNVQEQLTKAKSDTQGVDLAQARLSEKDRRQPRLADLSVVFD